MVIIYIGGGLGNQMFQYAFAQNFLAQNKHVKFLVSKNHRDALLLTQLEHAFPRIKLDRANEQDILRLSSYDRSKGISMDQGKYYFVNEIERFEFSYRESLLKLDDVYMMGYWQNHKYFERKRTVLKDRFTFKAFNYDDTFNADIALHINHSNSVGIHVRRGDYNQSPIHRIVPISYYEKAIKMIASKVEEAHFFIFTDDLEFVKINFSFLTNSTLVSVNTGLESFRDMQLMNMCKHLVIANSTFSWWSAWLNESPARIIVAPKEWFNTDIDFSGLIMPDWYVI